MNRRDFAKAIAAFAVHATDGGTAERHHANLQLLESPDRFNVRDFGAVGDGTTDDSAAFEMAILRAAQARGSVFVPSGIFRVKKMLTIRSGVSVVGMGNRSVLEHVDGDPIAVLCSNVNTVSLDSVQLRGRFAFGVVIDRCADVVVRKCMISGGTVQWSPTGFCGGILAMYSNGVTIEGNELGGNGLVRPEVLSSDIQVNGFGKRVASHGIRIAQNQCRSTSTQCCISVYDTQRSEIRSNVCSGAKTGRNNNNGYGIMIYQTEASPGSCFENTVAKNRISEIGGTAIYLKESNKSRVLSNVIENVANVQSDESLPVAGVALNQSQYVVIADNRITHVGRAGISIASNRPNVGHVEVKGNAISHAGGMGVHLRGILTDVRVTCNRVIDANGGIGNYTEDPQDLIVISDNEVAGTKASSAGIILTNAGKSSVKNNRVSDSGGYGLALTLRDDESDVSGNTIARSGRAFGGNYPNVRISRTNRGASPGNQ